MYLPTVMVITLPSVITPSGCGTTPGTFLDDGPDSTLQDTVISDDDSQDDDVLDPADVTGSDPTLSLKAAPVFCCDPLSIEFEVSVDADGGPVTDFAWDFGDGRTGEGAAVEHTYQWYGTYTVVVTGRLRSGAELVAENVLTLEASDTGGTEVTLITLDDTDSAPALTVDAGTDREVRSGDAVTLTGAVFGHSSSPDSSGLRYAWSQTEGPSVNLEGKSSSVATFIAPEVGELAERLTFELTVTKGELQDRDSVVIVIAPRPTSINLPPTVESFRITTAKNTSVQFQLSGLDPEGDELSFTTIRAPYYGHLELFENADPRSVEAVYTPDSEFVGMDSFVVQASDGSQTSAPAGVLVDVIAGDETLTALDAEYLVPRNTSVRLVLYGDVAGNHDPGELGFLVSDPPAHGSLSIVTQEGLDSASVVYTPSAGFQGTDSFKFRASNDVVESADATVSLTVMKLLVPWLEVNSPISSAESIFTEHQGALPGMTRLDYCLAGLEYWSQVTDLVIISTAPGQVDRLYPELMRRKPPHLRIIGGIKTYTLPGIAEDDERPYDFADAREWASIVEDVQRIATMTGMDTVVLENETAIRPFTHGEESIDFARLEDALIPLRESGVRTWWWLPWIMSNDPESFPDRQVFSTDFVSAVVQAVPTCTFMTEYVSWYGWEAYYGIIDRRQRMFDLVGAERALEGLFVTPDGYVQLEYELRRAYTPDEALDELPKLSGDMARIYPTGAYWILMGREFAERLPPLGTRVPAE
jgi:hypothetical protein